MADESNEKKESGSQEEPPAQEKKDSSKSQSKDSPDDKSKNSGQEKPQGDKPKKKRLWLVPLIIVVLVVAVFFGYRLWQHASTHEDTDDAYVTGNTHQVSSRVSGTVLQVMINDNWHVKAGQNLVVLDSRDYEVTLRRNRAQLNQAKAQVDAAQAAVQQAKADLQQREAQVSQAEAQVIQSTANSAIAKINYARSSGLFQRDLRAVAKQDVDTNKSTLDGANGALDAARATLKANQAQVESAKAQVESAVAQLENSTANVAIQESNVRDAELQLSYCKIVAPVDGMIAQKSVQSGNRTSPGQALMAIVEDNVWVLANLKETQLEKVQIGQPVEIKVDALPHEVFRGKVDSLQPGTGSNFALLPPDNATGNFIKIVQRVPVKILFDEASIRNFRNKILPGLSTVPSIDVSARAEAAPNATPITQARGSQLPGVMD